MPEVRVVASHDLSAAMRQRIREFLDDAFAGGFTDDDWEHASGGWHAIVTTDGALVSHAAVVPREIEVGRRALRAGYVEAVATAPAVRRRGHGTRAMRAAMEVVRREFDIGVLSTGQHRFYEPLGWQRWRGPTFVIQGGERVRTPDEDDGIMVLRFGPTVDLPLGDPISCWSRAGDDW